MILLNVVAQHPISGTVITAAGNPVAGANVYLQGSYDGSTSDSLGHFRFTTDLRGSQLLLVSYVGFETGKLPLEISGEIAGLKLVLSESAGELDEVVINAGTFEASDRKKSVILRPMDIALTAGANGDIYGAFGTLPGSHRVGEEGRLFVRGGESYETKTYMDGMLIQTPYFSKMPDLPTRGRFSPMLFNGAVFSTGGYSAEFGQALSSVVALNTTALEAETKSSISLLSVGVQGSHAHRWPNTSLAITGELLHTGLSNRLFRQEIDWISEPVIAGSTVMFRQKTSETGMVKAFGSFSYNSGRMRHLNFGENILQEISLDNRNNYLNVTWNEMAGEHWMVQTGLAFNQDADQTGVDRMKLEENRKNSQVKTVFTYTGLTSVTARTGFEYHFYDYRQLIQGEETWLLQFENRLLAVFAEPEVKLGRNVALRAGIRLENNSLPGSTRLDPRLSAAFRTGSNSQLSAAYGTFFQNPEDRYLKFSAAISPERSGHSILTWQYRKDSRTLRVEAYNKDYSDLVKFREEFSPLPGNFTNTGKGYSRGFDLFWRDQKAFGKSDYWISYSWNDSKRDYRDFPQAVRPPYASEHNLSAVYKRFFPSLSSFVSATWSHSSGRPYHDPNRPGFMKGRTPSYNDISMGLTHIFYLFNTQAVAHLIMDNLFGFEQVFGYTSSKEPDSQGVYTLQAVTPPQKRMAVLLISVQL
jgi:hypothetical protein